MNEIVIDEGDDRRYRIEVPNMIDDSDLSVYAFRLYAHLKRRAGDSGKCYEGVRPMAKHCQMSLASVVKAKLELVEKGFIRITPGDKTTSTPDTIRIVNVWQQNLSTYQTCSPIEQGCSPNEHPVRESHLPCSPNEHPVRVVEHKKEPVKKEQKKEETEEASSRASPRSPHSRMSEEEFMDSLKTEPAYAHINLEMEAGKMRHWCEVRNKQPTRRRFINWLNNIEPPLNGVNGNAGPTKPQRANGSTNADRIKSNLKRFGVEFAQERPGSNSGRIP